MILILENDSPTDFTPKFRNVPFEEKTLEMTAFLREVAIATDVILICDSRCRWMKSNSGDVTDKTYSVDAIQFIVSGQVPNEACVL